MDQYRHEIVPIEKAGCDFASFMAYLGYKNKPYPAQVEEITKALISEAAGMVKAEYGYLIFAGSSTRDTMVLNNVCFEPGKTIGFYLSDCSHYAVLLATTGKRYLEWTGKIKEQNDHLWQYLTDSLGSFIVENISAYAQEQLKSQAALIGLNITNSYSPGYCEWDITEQKKLFTLLPADFCGVSLSPAYMMHPLKSISAIIGIGRNAKRFPYHCALCKRKDCYLRKHY